MGTGLNLGLGLSGAAGGALETAQQGLRERLLIAQQALDDEMRRAADERARQEQEFRFSAAGRVEAEARAAAQQGLRPGSGPATVTGLVPTTPARGVMGGEEVEGPRAGVPPGVVRGISAVPSSGATSAPGEAPPRPGVQMPTPLTVAGVVPVQAPGDTSPRAWPIPAIMAGGKPVPGAEGYDRPIKSREQVIADALDAARLRDYTTRHTLAADTSSEFMGEVTQGPAKPLPGLLGDVIADLKGKLGRPLTADEKLQVNAKVAESGRDPGVAEMRNFSKVMAEQRLDDLRVKHENNRAQAKALVRGDLVPSMLKGRESFGEVVRMADEESMKETGKPFNFKKAELDYFATRRFVAGQNSNQRQVYRALAVSVVNTIDEVKALAEQLKQGSVQKFNEVRRDTILQVYGNTPLSGLAAQYLAAINTLKEEYANLAQGGYAPTESAWALSHQVVGTNFGVKDLTESLDEVQRLVNFRTNAYDELTPWLAGGNAGRPQYKVVNGQLVEVK